MIIMKGISPLVGYILVIAISLAAIAIVIQSATPLLNRGQEVSLFNEVKNNMNTLESATRSVITEGLNSTRVLNLKVSGGTYKIDTLSDKFIFEMDSKNQLVGDGVSYIENNLNFSGSPGKVTVFFQFSNVDFIGGGEFGSGNREVSIRNFAYDNVNKKYVISILPK